ncbi:hypothetical protein CsatA_016203 [Cannabis sativa]
MSATLATYHGGDGDGRDPPDPSRVPSSCEAGKVVGTEASNYVRLLGQQVSMLCPGGHLNFSDVPQQYKDQVLNRIRGGPPGEHVVEAWKEIHVKKPSGTFVNELAAKDYEELIKELDRKRLERQSQSDTGTESESDTGYQFDVMETVLGQRSDYQRGVGKRLKGKGKKPIPQTQSTVPPQPTTEMMNTVADIFSAMRATWGGNFMPEQRAQIFNPRFDNFIQTYSQSQSPGGSSSQSHAAPPEQQQQPPSQPQFQPSLQQQFQNLSQQQFENFLQQQPQSFPQQFPQQQQQSAPPMGNQFLYRTPSESPPLGSNFADFGLFGSSSQENQFYSTPIFNQAELGNLTLGLSSDQAYVPSPPRASGPRTENNPDQDFIIRDLNEDVNE